MVRNIELPKQGVCAHREWVDQHDCYIQMMAPTPIDHPAGDAEDAHQWVCLDCGRPAVAKRAADLTELCDATLSASERKLHDGVLEMLEKAGYR